MALTQYGGGNKTYLSIIDGTLRKQVTQETPGAVKRDWTTPDGKSGTKYECIYDSVSGIITRLSFNDSEYGKFLIVGFNGGEVLNLNTSHRYFTDLVKKLANADLTKEIALKPFDFENDDKKRITGVSVTQDGVKLTDYFYDATTKKNINGFPLPEGDTKKYDKDDWKVYFVNVKKFLISYVMLNLVPKIEAVEEVEEPVTPVVEEKEYKLEDVGF